MCQNGLLVLAMQTWMNLMTGFSVAGVVGWDFQDVHDNDNDDDYDDKTDNACRLQ